jgi:hypothetical protein
MGGIKGGHRRSVSRNLCDEIPNSIGLRIQPPNGG